MVLEAFPEGTWHTGVSRFYRLARSHLARLERLVLDVNAKWPKALDESVKDHEITPELDAMVLERDTTSDTCRIFAAMAVEAFLNFYGAARLGEEEFNSHFERLAVVPKTRQLLLICDRLSIAEGDPLIKALKAVAESRNKLVHPKAKKASPGDDPEKYWSPIPGAAREAVAAMETFFSEFQALVPDSLHFLPMA